MAFSFKQWFLKRLGGDAQKVSLEEIEQDEFWAISSELYVRELAFWACVNLMGNALSKCKFKTFQDGKEIKKADYYLWNYSPNKNQNKSAFLHKLVKQLYSHNEALVVESGEQLLVADSFAHKEFALVDDVFSQVTIGDFTFSKPFYQSDVLYFKLSEKDMRQVSNGLYSVYQKLIDYTMKSYQKSRGMKGVMEIDTAPAGDSEFQKTLQSIQNGGFKSFAEAESAILPIWKGMKFTKQESPTYSNEGTRDIRAMINDVSDFTAKAFGIPPAMLSGEVAGTKEAEKVFLSYSVESLAKMLEQEITRKRYGLSYVQRGSYLLVDTKAVRHIDMVDDAANLEKWISSGVYCVNEIRMSMGDQIIDEPWAWQHFITKNFAEIEKAAQAMKGGENI